MDTTGLDPQHPADVASGEWLPPFLGPPDVSRFRFREGTVEFRRAPAEANVLHVRAVR